MINIKYLAAGLFFGITLVKSQVISWFRIQEMFHLKSFHMYGIIGSAIAVGMLSVALIKWWRIRTLAGEQIIIPAKQFYWGNVIGGLIFGFGWALTGACPGPIFALVGSGYLVFLLTFLSAIAGTWIYGLLQNKLPR